MILGFKTDKSGQTVKTQIRLLLFLIFYHFSDCASVNVESDRYDDNDVQQEMTRLAHRGNNENSLVARNVSKVIIF